MVTRENRNHRITKICDELSHDLRAIHELGPRPEQCSNAKNAIDALCTFAFDLALSLRTCKAEYAWHQTIPPLPFNGTDFEKIPGYDVGTKGPIGRPTKILFGPVYKQVDGKLVLLVEGMVLYI